jgi:microcystin-dependent protein
MADLPELNEWPEGIYQLELSDPVLGGPEGIDNLQAKQLASRTIWLKDQIAKIVAGTSAVGKALQLKTARTLKFTGAATGSGTYDGSADTEIALTLPDSGVVAGSFTKVSVSAKGLVTSGSNPTTLAGYGITDVFTKEGTATAISEAISGHFVSIAASRPLTKADIGLVQIDSSAAAVTVQLPKSDVDLGIRDLIVRRTDNTGNRLVIQADGSDKIKFHTHLRAEGYSFFVLMGAGDYWHLRSDGAGGWVPIARFDGTPLGRPVFETTTAFSPGGWVAHNGFIYSRAEWPWAWDHAQASGMLTTEAARTGLEGCWTSGDGVTTFRSPEARGDIIRMLDEGRGVDVGRVAGSFQKGSLQTFDPNRNSLSVTGLTHSGADTDIAAKHGLDPATLADYPQSTVVTMDNTPTTAINTAGGVVRPRNTAYPGRIKLI